MLCIIESSNHHPFQFNARYKPQRGRRYSELRLCYNAEAQPQRIDRSAMLVRDNCEIACRSCVTRRFQHRYLLKPGVCFRKSLLQCQRSPDTYLLNSSGDRISIELGTESIVIARTVRIGP